MFLVPQMLSDETLRARYRDDVKKASVLSPNSPLAKELQQEIDALAKEQ